MKPNQTLLDTLLELQALDRTPRSGYALRGVDSPESVSEHAWHVSFLVWALGDEEPGLDLAHAIEIALVHDLAEVRTGDLPMTANRYLPEGAKHAAETAAARELTAPLGERAVALLEEFNRAQTREARFVKACDKLQLMIKVARYESWGAGGLAGFWDNPDNFPVDEFDAVNRLRRELRERFAKTYPVTPSRTGPSRRRF